VTDTAALQRTIRRCTAVLVVVLSQILVNTDPYDPSNSIGNPIAALAVVYLALSLLVSLGRSSDADSEESDGGSGGTGGASGGDATDAESAGART